jgi:hypothetical protein
MARKPRCPLLDPAQLPAMLQPKQAVLRAAAIAPTLCVKPIPRPLRIPSSDRITSIAHYMAYQQMLRHHIVPYPTMTADYGIDHLTVYNGNVIQRVQIKGQEAWPEDERRLTFSIKRSGPPTTLNGKRCYTYDPASLDVFIFVHIELHRYFIMPMSEVQRYSSNVTFSPETNARWENAWDVLMERNSV